ncbi:hypothetical protein MVEN_00020000 [Mycena venus]|uniref:Uncharacterized protein n=1 Tax=Mycena venus TaxID=2733690 RepID=A0A8H6Z2Y1_9AGAR|nr:hypothetical protein MVEN_00020000 [Mycena venus]
MCGFRWSTSWNKDNPPAVDAGLSSLRTLLLEQGEELSQSSSAPNQPPQSLDAEHERCVADRMSIVLSASAGAYTIHAQRNGVQVYEAESRHDWDHLLYHFYARSDEETSPYVLLERTIHYPRNHLADTLSNNHFFDNFARQLAENLSFSRAALGSVLMQSSVLRQAFVAVDRADQLNKKWTEVGAATAKKLIGRHSQQEPREGILDAILVAVIPRPLHLRTISDVEFIRYISDAPSITISPAAHAVSSVEKGFNAEVQERDYVQYLQNPFTVSINETELSFTREGTPKFDVSRQLLFPHVVVEYKKPSDTAGKALNRGRMYLVSIVSFYVALGIEDRPFFCLVTAGKVGVLLMAWKSSKQKKTYLMERNVMKFDISSPVQAFHFATILLRLRDDQEELKELAKAKLACKSFDWEKFKCWRKASQEVELALAGAAAASTQAAK